MHTTQYQKNVGLDTENVRNKIFQYLNKKIDTRTKYHPLDDVTCLDTIKNGKYIACPKVSGTKSWVLFFKSDNIFYAVNFPKHSLVRRDNTEIFAIEIGVSASYYRGTIMEGTYYRTENERYLVIDDVYVLAGDDQLAKTKSDRLQTLSESFRTCVRNTDYFSMYVCQYYQILPSSLEYMYSIIKTNPLISEIHFCPQMYGGKIYTYTLTEKDLIDQVITYGVFNMKKTTKTDVYQLFTPDGEKVDIAYIPSMELSKTCRKWFSSTKKKSVCVKCYSDMVNNKWIPIELHDQKTT
jgi:hypothetical protein